MVEITRPRLNRSLPLVGAAVAGFTVALTAAVVPAAWLENAVEVSGIGAIVTVAQPPLGATARAVLALGGGVGLASVVWAALYLLVGPGGLLARTSRASAEVPAIRFADAHPDAPPRRPLSATDLPEIALPQDLDTPMAAFDPDAVPPVPLEPARALKPLAKPAAMALAPGERLAVYALTPPPPSLPPTVRTEPPSIDALLRRLEQGTRRRAAPAH